MASSDAPVSIGKVTLVVRDLPKVSAFYQRVLGLHPQGASGETVTLCAGGTPLILLHQDRAARSLPQEAGLFHNAFLLPEEHHLGDWIDHAAGLGLRLDGASDHLVSEALYLRDPEDNGIEVYWDRPRASWKRSGDEIAMDTIRLDLGAVPRGTGWRDMPEGSVIGHVHLQVGDITAADQFFTRDLGMTRTSAMPTAGWYGAGGYHHHLAGNIWNSQGAGQRSTGAAGLAEVELLAQPGLLPARLSDPFGTQFTVTES